MIVNLQCRMHKLYQRSIRLFTIIFFLCTLVFSAQAQKKKGEKTISKTTSNYKTVLYGQASFYAAKFQGRRTASGQVFNHSALTAACNALPLGTWLRVTNLRNGKTVVVRTNDRLHAKTGRLVDLTKAAATKLGFVKAGLTRVKVEVLPANNIK